MRQRECCGINLGDINQPALWFHKRPRFLSSAPNNRSRLTLSSLANYILINENQKMSQSFSHNTNSFNTTVSNITIADDRSQILTWLSPLELRLRHQDIRDRRVENVGKWILQTEEFRSWHAGSGEGGESNDAVLFCYGDPGVGKTYIR